MPVEAESSVTITGDSVDHGCAHCGVLDLVTLARASNLGLHCSTRHCAARDFGLVA